jgi:signal transduction histidine kinase/CheY-like chemotaxis protein
LDQSGRLDQTSDGAIWIAYREPAGISRLLLHENRSDVRHFTRKEGLPSDYVLFLGIDSRQRLWVGTDNGVALASSKGWVVYTHEDGLGWDDCSANGFWPDADGAVWIGSLKGLSRFRPMRQPEPPPPPPAAIISLRFGDHGADPSLASSIPVSYRNRDLSVTFSGLTFLREKEVRFRYRLLGFDERWIETTQREARFSSLPPGSYRFEVIAGVAEGIWSTSPAAVSFHVVPPWWMTWWFRLLASAIAAGVTALMIRLYMNRVRLEQKRLEAAVRERTCELELQKDVVERQKREIEVLLDQSREVSRLKSEFLANMSHEIRTPMNGVIGMTDLVLGTSLDSEQRDYMSTIRDSAEALMVVINDILDFSKIEAGRMELAREPFQLRKCLADALQVFAWRAGQKGLRLVPEVAPGVPDWVVGDADRLRQILLNLVGNAMKFTDSGEIAVSLSLAAPADATSERSRTLLFSVRDTGIGIPLDKQAMIFEAFAQVDGSTRRRQGGTGLGLAICSKLVRLMHGQIRVESAPGHGATFSFTIAADVADPVPEPFESTPPEAKVVLSNSRLRILLAEDNAVNQKLARRALEKLGHAIEAVDDGVQAVNAVEAGAFDLVLMDVQMPEMDGLEATRRIRARESAAAGHGRPGRHIPIIAMTAHAMRGDRDLCLDAGMDDYISKPIHLQTLVETIERVRMATPNSHPIGSRNEPNGEDCAPAL